MAVIYAASGGLHGSNGALGAAFAVSSNISAAHISSHTASCSVHPFIPTIYRSS